MIAVAPETAAQRLARFALALAYDEVPPPVIEAAKLHLLDTLGCALAAHALGIGSEGRDVVEQAAGVEEATVVGLDARLPAPAAAFANAMLSHALDFDDTHSASVAHVSVVVVPAALAAAEAYAADGRELLAAVVAGNEIVTRVGMVASGAFHSRGFHPTAVCGIFGGTAAAARLARLGDTVTASALGMAGSFAGGLFAYLDAGTATKPLHPAWAAQGSLTAARLAAAGAEGPPTVLEGRFGLYHAFTGAEPGSLDVERHLGDLGERWETPRIAFKPYPACHFIHGSLGATASLLGRVDPAEIDEIVVTLPEAGVALVTEPTALKIAPRTEYEAKFSLQYSTAAMLVHGEVGVGTYTEDAIRDERVLELARLVRYEVKDYATFPEAFPGGVRITTRDGRTLEADAPHQLGGPGNPMSADEVQAKFRGNAALALGDGDVAAVEDAVLGLETRADVSDALAPLTRARPAS
jgi:2-methylcitrate dehydratase PrpD